jgi:16S rRNA (guanine527-N7)-methyltransferase
MQWIPAYFPELAAGQLEQLFHLQGYLLEWNEKLNLVSRPDAENLEERHLLSSLAIAKFITFPKGSRIMDVGTGGGLPGLPLAILFPDCEFLLVDSIGKKIAAVNDMAGRLGLGNVKAVHARVETIPQKFDFITGRAVKALPLFLSWVLPNLKTGSEKGVEKGVIYLKGGELGEELDAIGTAPWRQASLLEYYPKHPFFDTKHVLQFRSVDLLKSPLAKNSARR